MIQSYTTYEFYTSEYGGVNDAPIFEKLEKRASAKLNYLTFGNITNETLDEYDYEVQMSVCAIIDAMAEIDKRTSDNMANVKSMSSGGQSVSFGDTVYTDAVASEDAQTKLFRDKVTEYLFPTGLLYAGVSVW